MAIEILRLPTSHHRLSLLERFDGKSATWVVADVRSKLAIQRRLLLSNGFVDGHSVVRASELWSSMLRRLEPDLQIVSRELISVSIAAQLAKRKEPWLVAPGAAKTAFDYIRQLLPVLATSDVENGGSAELLDEWLAQEENAPSRERWRSWYQIALEIWRELRSQKLCTAGWVAGVLVAERERLGTVANRNLIVDLGAELSHVEAELLLAIADAGINVTILRPSPNWESDYPDGRLAADWLAKRSADREIPCTVKTAEALNGRELSATPTYKRLPSAAAEVKEAVAKVREWLDCGVDASEIGIAAPDLEAYWPVLSLHLEAEGISSAKSVVSMLHSFPDMMKWLARLRIRTGIPDSRDLEMDLFGEGSSPLTFTSFREIFARVYEASDLELSDKVLKYFEAEYRDRGRWPSEVAGRDEFLIRAASVLRSTDDSVRAIRVLKTVLEECPPDLRFDYAQWVKYLSEVTARIEIPVIMADPGGVACLGLASLEGVECSHVVIMGLHEGALRSMHGTAIHTTDLRAIERDLGFVIDGEDRKRTEYEARWILSQPRRATHLLFADTDLGGTVQTPSWSWISGAWAVASKTPEIDVPLVTRFDEQMGRQFDSVGSKSQRQRLRRETDQEPQPTFAAGVVQSLSASLIDDVSKCALRFAFQRILGPRDDGALDLDIDHRRRGTLQHKIFELLGRAQWRPHTDEELLGVVEQAKSELEEKDGRALVRTEAAWKSLQRRMLRVARWLLEFEIAERRRIPDLRTESCEAVFAGEVHAGGDSDKMYPLRGQVDRIDTRADGRKVLIDYKNRTDTPNFSKWTEKNFWQPLVYAYAYEKGWLKTSPGEIAGIFIYDIQKRKRGNGLRIREGNEDMFEFKLASQGETREDLRSAIGELQSQIRYVTGVLDRGEFLPKPAKLTECDRCAWQMACRAPHLELDV